MICEKSPYNPISQHAAIQVHYTIKILNKRMDREEWSTLGKNAILKEHVGHVLNIKPTNKCRVRTLSLS